VLAVCGGHFVTSLHALANRTARDIISCKKKANQYFVFLSLSLDVHMDIKSCVLPCEHFGFGWGCSKFVCVKKNNISYAACKFDSLL
jgi:hypothetical protein